MPKNKPEIVTVPKANYIAVRGKGNPNEIDCAYQQAISILYAVAYTLKMSYKTEHKIEGFFEYVVPPLEGFWWQDITMTIVVSLTMIFVGCYLMKAHLALGIALLAFGAAVVFATCFVGVRIEHDTGYYECPVCKKRYVPTMKAVVMALHSGTSRKMKCPYCGNKSYHKKVLTK